MPTHEAPRAAAGPVKRPLDDQKAATLMPAASSRRERLAGSAVGFGGGGARSAGVYTSAAREGMGVEELLNDGQEEVFSRTEVESGRIEHHVGEEPATGPVRCK